MRFHSEEQYLPSLCALKLHWLQSTWVYTVLRQIDLPYILFPDINKFGWKLENNEITVVWDSKENITLV